MTQRTASNIHSGISRLSRVSVSIDLAPEHPTASPRLADHDILVVQWMPWVQDPSNVRLMITAVGTSTTRDAAIFAIA